MTKHKAAIEKLKRMVHEAPFRCDPPHPAKVLLAFGDELPPECPVCRGPELVLVTEEIVQPVGKTDQANEES